MKLSKLTIWGGAVLAVLVLGAAGVLWHLRPRTQYAPGFSEEAFARIEAGMSGVEVIEKIGEPLSQRTEVGPERWCYGPWPKRMPKRQWGFLVSRHEFDLDGPPCLEFGPGGRAVTVLRDRDGKLAPAVGLEGGKVRDLIGEPHHVEPAGEHTVLFYSALDGDDGSYDVRSVVVSEGRVLDRVEYTLWD